MASCRYRRAAAADLLAAFLRYTDRDPTGQLGRAVARRQGNRTLSAAEIDRIPAAAALVTSAR